MAPRGRNKQKNVSESGTSSIAESEDAESTSTSRRPRRSRQPKRYFDDDYSPPPAKRGKNRETPVSDAPYEEEEQELKLETKTPSTSTATRNTSTATPATAGRPKPKGRPKKNPTPPRAAGGAKSRKSRQQLEEDIIYMDDEESEEEEDSDDEFLVQDEPQEEEEMEIMEEDSSLVMSNNEEEIFCPWAGLDPETLPKLELPESSQDIPLPKHHTMDAIEVYEILRSYHRTLRITPFTFEDFCAALLSKNNSCIMAEVHMALLRVCLKSDDEEQTHYSVTETNNAVNIMLHHMDTLTYAEILRQYIEAYPYSDSSVRDAINVENYPYVGYEAKLVVLLFMSYRFLYSSEFKKVVNNAGKFQNDENCRVCGKSSGRVIGCSQCEAAFHVECSQVKPFPEVLVCFICKKNDVKGVLPLDECVEREPLRSQPIGRDRYGRLYWFMARRIFVQSQDETEIHYYSTPPQLYQLLNSLDREYYERDLCDVIRERINEFLEQMTLTLEMTTEKREGAIEILMKKNQWNYEYAEATIPSVYLHKDSMKRMASILQKVAEKTIKKDIKLEDSEDSLPPLLEPQDPAPEVKNEDSESSQPPPSAPKYPEDTILPETMLGIYNGELINAFWSGGATQEDLTTHHAYYQNLENLEPERRWRLGDVANDESFMAYYNYYYKNEMSESFSTRKKVADKKKYMASKFATIDTFDWVVAKDRLFYGNSMLHTKFVAWTLSKTARKIPADLMHRRYPDVAKQFDLDITNADDYKKLAKCLLELDAMVRRTVFMPQWWNGLGQTRLERITQEQREQFVKEQQRVKKMEVEALSKDLDESQWIRVNYSKPKWPNTYILRQKGETYRNAGKGQMGGWAWVAKKYQEKWVPVPETPQYPLPSVGSKEEKKIKYTANRKARHLDSLILRITDIRDMRESKLAKTFTSGVSSKPSSIPQNTYKCYSPACRRIKQNIHCYSPSCRQNQRKMRKLMMEEEAKMEVDEEVAQKKEAPGVLGEDRPWPIPEIQTFSSSRGGGGRSLFVLQKRILRRLIVSAGCQSVYMPGFSSNIKSNLLIWPYPSARPSLDLCWKWQTINARNLHAVALQLRIMWSSIKWNEFEPEDNHPDRRVVIDTPNHDERRRIVKHREMPPYGQYERYELEIEIIPLHDEQEDDDESWLSRSNRSTDCSQKGPSRVIGRKAKRPRTIDHRVATSIRHEWVDGISLKVFEIKDYWKNVRLEHEKQMRKKLDAMRRAQRAKEEAERQRQIQQQRIAAAQRTPSVLTPSSAPAPGSAQYAARARYLEKYNTASDLSPCPPSNSAPLLTPGYIPPSRPTPSQYSTSSSSSSVPRVAPNPVRIPVSALPRSAQLEIRQSRVAAGADFNGYHQSSSSSSTTTSSGGVPRMMGSGVARSGSGGGQYYAQQGAQGQVRRFQPSQQQYTSSMSQYPLVQRPAYSNGQQHQPYQNTGGRLVQEQYQQLPQQRRVIVTPQNHYHQSQNQQRPVAGEEAYGSSTSSTTPPPQIQRYDNPGGPVSQGFSQGGSQHHQTPRPSHQIYTGQQMVRTVTPGTAIGQNVAQKKFVYVKNQDGTIQGPPQPQRVVVRNSGDSMNYPPGTVLPGPPNGPPGSTSRLVTVRTNGGATQTLRQIVGPDGTTRFVRAVRPGGGEMVHNSGAGGQIVRRVIPVTQHPRYQQQQQVQIQRQPFQDLMEHDQQHPSTSSSSAPQQQPIRYAVVQGGSAPGPPRIPQPYEGSGKGNKAHNMLAQLRMAPNEQEEMLQEPPQHQEEPNQEQ